VAVLVLDAGVLIAHDRGDRFAAAWFARASGEGVDLAVAGPTIEEAWRDGTRQARLARLLQACRVVDCDAALARAAGQALAKARSSNTIDAIVTATAHRLSGVVLTDDLNDIEPLARIMDVRVARLTPARPR
jgi:predicted nucleic acid-binding protein